MRHPRWGRATENLHQPVEADAGFRDIGAAEQLPIISSCSSILAGANLQTGPKCLATIETCDIQWNLFQAPGFGRLRRHVRCGLPGRAELGDGIALLPQIVAHYESLRP